MGKVADVGESRGQNGASGAEEVMPYTAQWSAEGILRESVNTLPGTTLIEFGAEWCPHCQAVQDALRETLEELPEVRHLKVEDGKGRPLGRSFAVKLWPNFVFLKDGKVLNQLARPAEDALRAAVGKLAE